jgi:hypothetical protein
VSVLGDRGFWARQVLVSDAQWRKRRASVMGRLRAKRRQIEGTRAALDALIAEHASLCLQAAQMGINARWLPANVEGSSDDFFGVAAPETTAAAG